MTNEVGYFPVICVSGVEREKPPDVTVLEDLQYKALILQTTGISDAADIYIHFRTPLKMNAPIINPPPTSSESQPYG